MVRYSGQLNRGVNIRSFTKDSHNKFPTSLQSVNISKSNGEEDEDINIEDDEEENLDLNDKKNIKA